MSYDYITGQYSTDLDKIFNTMLDLNQGKAEVLALFQEIIDKCYASLDTEHDSLGDYYDKMCQELRNLTYNMDGVDDRRDDSGKSEVAID